MNSALLYSPSTICLTLPSNRFTQLLSDSGLPISLTPVSIENVSYCKSMVRNMYIPLSYIFVTLQRHTTLDDSSTCIPHLLPRYSYTRTVTHILFIVHFLHVQTIRWHYRITTRDVYFSGHLCCIRYMKTYQVEPEHTIF